MKRRILIIDNEPQDEEIEKLKRDAHNIGIDLDCDQYNVGSTKETALLDNGVVSIDKVVSEYLNRFQGRTYSLAAFDWDLNDDITDGIELIRQFQAKNILKSTPKMLYSGLLDEKLKEKFNSFKTGRMTLDRLTSQIKTMINIELHGFCKREDYDKFIISYLRKAEEPLDFIVEDVLNSYPELHFIESWGNNSFRGKRFLEVAKIIQSDANLKNELKREIIEQCIAYLTNHIGYATNNTSC